MGDWINAEIEYQSWLEQDHKRLDFSLYNTKEQIRGAILEKLPLGSSEEAVKAFFLANLEQGYSSQQEWVVEEFPCGYVGEGESGCEYGVVFRVWETNAGSFLERVFRGHWIIIFELDPEMGRLTNVIVRYYGFVV